MSCMKEMLSVVMDGIKDANMWLDYAMRCKEQNDIQTYQWFFEHANKRIETLNSDYTYVKKNTGIDEKIKAMDEMAVLLNAHIMSEIDDLRRKADNYA